MQIVIPMSGKGVRFQEAGYRDLKPLIEVDGAPMIEHVIKMFPGETDFLFICSNEALAETPLRATLERLAPRGRIVAIASHKLGPVYAVLQAEAYIRADQPVIVNYCDFAVEWDYADFKRLMNDLRCEGCVTAYKGFHPHSLGPNLYAYLRHEKNYLLEIAEKHNFTENRLQEYASAGTYYFRSGELLLRYFKMAVECGLSTNGEFYASMPFNLLVKDSLKVFVYELTRFLQWGTPEDLEEYKAWSRYFSEFEDWLPSLPPHAGTNLVPMAGAGLRFAKEGYTDPKPLVPVDGKRLVERSLECLPAAANWVAVCLKAHLADQRLTSALHSNGRSIQILETRELTSGQASTCLLAREHVDPEKPLLIAPCDSATVFDEQRFARLTGDPMVDCVVFTFRNHPHANRNPRQYGWVLTDDDGAAKSVICKEEPPGRTNCGHGVIGTFWFRKAKYFFEAADQLIAQDRRINNEFYVDLCIQVLIEQGYRVQVFPVTCYICLGTPDDVRTYEYWAGHFHKMRSARKVGA